MDEANMMPENKPDINLTATETEEQKRKEAIERFKILSEKPATKEKWFKTPVAKFISVIIAGAIVFEGVGMVFAELTNKTTISNETLRIDAKHPWNIGLQDPWYPEVKLGENAQYATPTDIRDFMQSPLPADKPDNEIKTPVDWLHTGVIAGIDLEKAGKVEWNTSGPFNSTGPFAGQAFPAFLEYYIENKNTPLGLFLPQGVNTDTVEISLGKPDMVNGQLQYYWLFEKFSFGDSRCILLDVRVNLILGEILKDVPVIDTDHVPDGVNWFQYIIKHQGKKISISDNPTLAYTRDANSTIYTSTIDSGYEHVPLPVPKTENGNILFIAPN